MLIEGIEFNEQEINGEFVLTALIKDVETFKKVNQFVKAHGGSYRKPMSFVFATKPDFSEDNNDEKTEEPVTTVEEKKTIVEEIQAEVASEEDKCESLQVEVKSVEIKEADVSDDEEDSEDESDGEETTSVEDKIIEMPKPKSESKEEKSIEASKKLLEIMQKKQRLIDEMNKRKNADASAEPEQNPESKPDSKSEPVKSTPVKQPLEDVTQKLKAITAKVEAEQAAAKKAAKTNDKPKTEAKGTSIEVYPPSSIEECEAFFEELKKSDEWSGEKEHKDFMDMIVKACKDDEELRSFVTHKDYYKTWESAGRTYCSTVKNHHHGSTKEQLLPYMITEYKKPITVSKSSTTSTKKK